MERSHAHLPFRLLVRIAGLSIFATTLFLASLPARPASTATTPTGFVSEIAYAGLPQATDFAFAPDGRTFVATKAGAVRIIKDGALLPTPFTTLPVNDIWDRGLIGLALDPDFATNGYVYLYFTYENNASAPWGPKTGRLVRVTASGDVAAPGSETVLLGSVAGDATRPSCQDFAPGADCIPADGLSHNGGGLRFASDGTLFMATGDAAFFAFGPEQPDLMSRSQNLDSLAGKILRVNRDGSAPADNPFFTGDPVANRSKVWAYGLRNPFRFGLQPGTDLPFIGDVGSFLWEEINVGYAGANFGWPCYEGGGPHLVYSKLQFCQDLFTGGATVAHPVYAYPNAYLVGATVIGGVFFQGAAYPPEFQNAYFFGDWVAQSISSLRVDPNNELIPASVTTVLSDAGGPVDFELGPDGDLYYLTLDADAGSSALRRLRFFPGNRPPVAQASAAPLGGLVPLTVQFSSATSSDPDGQPLSYSWDFHDGATSQQANPTHSFFFSGTYTVTLTVSDGTGGAASDTVQVIAGNQPPRAVIIGPISYSVYSPGQTIAFSGAGTDAEDGNLPDASHVWRAVLHHCPSQSLNCHTHPYLQQTGKGGALIAPDQGDDIMFIELTLTVTDGAGLTDSRSVIVGSDSDGDGLVDGYERATPGCDPLLYNDDLDGIAGNQEALSGANPCVWDSGAYGCAHGAWRHPGCDVDTDGDGCMDAFEVGLDPLRGGRRSATNPWDFYDPNRDGMVSIQDLIAVIRAYGPSTRPNYSPDKDRSPPPAAAIEPDPSKRELWDLGPPDGAITVGDVLAIVRQFWHSCRPLG